MNEKALSIQIIRVLGARTVFKPERGAAFARSYGEASADENEEEDSGRE
jgi:hypothetical protein